MRIRTYSGNWEDAVDPFVSWMENDMGYVPVDQKPKKALLKSSVNKLEVSKSFLTHTKYVDTILM